MSKNMMTVKLVRSRIKADSRQRRILDGLGLRRREHTKRLEDTPSTRGMVAKVQHLVQVLDDKEDGS